MARGEVIRQIRELAQKGLSQHEIAYTMAERGYAQASLFTLCRRVRAECGLPAEQGHASLRVPIASGPFAMLKIEAQERHVDVRILCLMLLGEIGRSPELIDAILDRPDLRRKTPARRRPDFDLEAIEESPHG